MTRGPKSPLAHSAMGELEHACRLFSKASVYSIRATKALVRPTTQTLEDCWNDSLYSFVANTHEACGESPACSIRCTKRY